MKKFTVLILASLVFMSCSSLSQQEISKATVMITNVAKTSGGSGSIVSHNDFKSSVLTNGHVCGVVKNGGFVITSSGEQFPVNNYRISSIHDLCLIQVIGNLGISVGISPTKPKRLDKATVSGHPSLLPNIITEGHFSDKIQVTIMIGSRVCNKEDLENPQSSFFCMFFGRVPVLKSYEAIVVSALIKPGSSGSAIYASTVDLIFGNKLGQISAVVFAGSGDIGYGLAVPHEYVVNFVHHELSHIHKQFPNYLLGSDSSRLEENKFRSKLYEFCSKEGSEVLAPICSLVNETAKYNDLVF